MDWTDNFYSYGPFGSNMPIMTTHDEQKETEELMAVVSQPLAHEFGATSDLCHHCGIGRGWFSRHEGKQCPMRVEKEIEKHRKQKAEKKQREIELTCKLKEIKAHQGNASDLLLKGPMGQTQKFVVVNGLIQAVDEKKPKRSPLKLFTGRKFR